MPRAYLCWILAILCLAPRVADAEGFSIWMMSPRATAMGGIGSASAMDATASFFNPAGLVRAKHPHLMISASTLIGGMEFSGVDPFPGYGVTERPTSPLHILPQFYLLHPLGQDFSAGIGFNTPFGLGFQWVNPETFSGRHIATRSDLRAYFLSPTISWRIRPGLTAGFGINIVRGSFRLEKSLVEYLDEPIETGTMVLAGESPGLNYGATLGLMADLGSKLRLGLNWKSTVRMYMEGAAEFTDLDDPANLPVPESGPAEGEMPLPGLLSIGLAYYPFEPMLLEFNVNHSRWSEYDKLAVHFPEQPENDLNVEENYIDALAFRLGLEYRLQRGHLLRAGAFYNQTPQPSAACGPTLPDSVHRSLSVGGAFVFPGYQLDWFQALVFLDERQVRDSRDGFNGDWRTFAWAGGLGLSYVF